MSDYINEISSETIYILSGAVFLFVILYKFFPKLFLKIHKPVFFIIGIISLSLGYIGIVVPGLPTTVFILISAWAFSKCSERFTYWLENHKLFGQMINNWKLYKGLSRKAKKFAILTIIPTFGITIYLVFNIFGDIVFGLFGIMLCFWLATRPEPPLNQNN